jgi:hypothetical protein
MWYSWQGTGLSAAMESMVVEQYKDIRDKKDQPLKPDQSYA